jgi:predicted enzyme related to lactoylglutathione lyase
MTCRLVALDFDANDPPRLARFWADVLNWEIAEAADDPEGGASLLPGDDAPFGLRLVRAQVRKPGRKQMHLHLTSTSLEDQQRTVTRALGLGARHIDVGQRPEEGHVVLADPEGNAFCVIEPGNKFLADCGFFAEVGYDGPREVGYFWSKALGWPLVWDRDQETSIRSPRGGPKISWGGPRPEAEKNRPRFDVALPVDGDKQAEIDRLISLGATRIGFGQAGAGRVVMADPDGNEFSVLTP